MTYDELLKWIHHWWTGYGAVE